MAILVYDPSSIVTVDVEGTYHFAGVSRAGRLFIIWQEDDMLKVEYVSVHSGTRIIHAPTIAYFGDGPLWRITGESELA